MKPEEYFHLKSTSLTIEEHTVRLIDAKVIDLHSQGQGLSNALLLIWLKNNDIWIYSNSTTKRNFDRESDVRAFIQFTLGNDSRLSSHQTNMAYMERFFAGFHPFYRIEFQYTKLSEFIRRIDLLESTTTNREEGSEERDAIIS